MCPDNRPSNFCRYGSRCARTLIPSSCRKCRHSSSISPAMKSLGAPDPSRRTNHDQTIVNRACRHQSAHAISPAGPVFVNSYSTSPPVPSPSWDSECIQCDHTPTSPSRTDAPKHHPNTRNQNRIAPSLRYGRHPGHQPFFVNVVGGANVNVDVGGEMNEALRSGFVVDVQLAYLPWKRLFISSDLIMSAVFTIASVTIIHHSNNMDIIKHYTAKTNSKTPITIITPTQMHPASCIVLLDPSVHHPHTQYLQDYSPTLAGRTPLTQELSF